MTTDEDQLQKVDCLYMQIILSLAQNIPFSVNHHIHVLIHANILTIILIHRMKQCDSKRCHLPDN